MKTKQEQIDEMLEDICNNFPTRNHCQDGKKCMVKKLADCNNCLRSIALYKAGYRKATEVIDDFVDRLKSKALRNCKIVDCYEIKFIETKIDDIAAEMRQEVEK